MPAYKNLTDYSNYSQDTYQWVWPPPDNEDSVEEISMLQNTMEEESFEQASDELSNSSPPNSRPGTSTPSDSGDVSIDTRQGGEMRADAETNGDVKHMAKNQAVKKVIMEY